MVDRARGVEGELKINFKDKPKINRKGIGSQEERRRHDECGEEKAQLMSAEDQRELSASKTAEKQVQR